MVFAECRQLPDFPVMSKDTLSKWSKRLGFCYRPRSKRVQVYQQFDVDIVPPKCNFIKNKALTQVSFLKLLRMFLAYNLNKKETAVQLLSCKFQDVFQYVIFLKTRFWHRFIPMNFAMF